MGRNRADRQAVHVPVHQVFVDRGYQETKGEVYAESDTRQQVGKLFAAVEHPALRPLPVSLFPVFEEALRTVHRDGYFECKRAYYAAPPEYLSRQVWVRQEARLVRLSNLRREPIALHALAEPGKFTTDHHCDHGSELSDQRLTPASAGNQKEPQVPRTCDRRRRELRLAARPQLVLTRSGNHLLEKRNLI